MFTKTMVALSAVFVFGAASVGPTKAAKARVRHLAPGFAQQYAPATHAARRSAVLPFTNEERALFDRASTVRGAGR